MAGGAPRAGCPRPPLPLPAVRALRALRAVLFGVCVSVCVASIGRRAPYAYSFIHSSIHPSTNAPTTPTHTQPRLGARILPIREIQAVGGVLRGDCLGRGWDQLALLPFTPKTGLDARGVLAGAGLLTNGARLWAHGRCVAVSDWTVPIDGLCVCVVHASRFSDSDTTPHTSWRTTQLGVAGSDEDKAVRLRKSWLRGQPAWSPPTPPQQQQEEDVETGSGSSSRRAAASGEETEEEEEQQRRARLVGGVRAALQGQLQAEAQEGARAAAAATTARALLRESERVLAALAYQDVLPPSSAMSSPPGGLTDDAAVASSSLVPLLPPSSADTKDDEQPSSPPPPPPPRPIFPIACFALRRRGRRRGRAGGGDGGVLGLEVRVRAADGYDAVLGCV